MDEPVEIGTDKWFHLRKAGLNPAELEQGLNTSVGPVTPHLLNNGAAWEVTRLGVSWPKKASYIRAWMGGRFPQDVRDRQVRSTLEKLAKERAKLLTKKKHVREMLLPSFLARPFTIPLHQLDLQTTCRPSAPTCAPTVQPALQATSCGQENTLKGQLAQTRRLLRNSKLREKRKDRLISLQKSVLAQNRRTIRQLKMKKEKIKAQKRKQCRELVHIRKLKYKQPSCDKSTQAHGETATCTQCPRYESELNRLQTYTPPPSPRSVSLLDKGRYSVDTVQCVLSLLSRSVSYEHVGHVIRAVLNMVRLHPDQVPSRATVERMSHLRLPLSQLHVATVFVAEEDTTLYSDETSKRGKQYETYVASSTTQIKVLGLREMSDKSASTNMETLQEVIQDLDTCGTDTGKTVVAHIKNTMSDRAAGEKKFQQLFKTYRNEVLAEVIPAWSELSEKEQGCYKTMHNFFCGLHLLVNAAETTNKALQCFEARHKTAQNLSNIFTIGKTNESETVHLIRAASKAFAPGGDEKNGCFAHCSVYLRAKGERECLSRFRGNRFNILFHNAALLFSQSIHLSQFLQDCHGTPNGLLTCVAEGLKSDLLLAGVRALGFIDKRLTKPLWQAIESKGCILDMNNTYRKMIATLGTVTAQEFMDGSVSVVSHTGSSAAERPDKVLHALMKPSHIDSLTSMVLEHLLVELRLAFQHLLKDQLPGGENSLKTSESNPECKSVIKHNKIPETIFGQLDYIIKTKPSASPLTCEATILYNFNQVNDWLASLGEEGLAEVVARASILRKTTVAEYRSRLREIEARKQEILRKKTDDLRKRSMQRLAEKTKLTDSVIFHGLWQNINEVDAKLKTYHSQTAAREALRLQLHFRKKVFLQSPSRPDLFVLSKNRKQKSVQELSCNLKQLISECSAGDVPPEEMSPLVGCKIGHRFEQEGSMVTYQGRVISQVPGFPRWFNLVYASEPESVYTFRLEEDLASNDLWILPDDESAEPEPCL